MKNASLNWVRLPLEGVLNCRELGGYPTSNGEQTAWHTFLRSSELSQLSPKDTHFIKSYGIHTIIDLRAEEELVYSPNPLATHADFTYEHHPLLTGELNNPMFANPTFQMGDMYVDLLENSPGIAPVMQTIARSEKGVLFHCSAGKDRTGIIAMLLLSLVGVSREDIVSNYEVTYTHIRPMFDVKIEGAPFDMDKMNPEFLYSKPASIEKAIEHLQKNYGDAASYLKTKGLTSTEIEQIQCLLTGDLVKH